MSLEVERMASLSPYKHSTSDDTGQGQISAHFKARMDSFLYSGPAVTTRSAAKLQHSAKVAKISSKTNRAPPASKPDSKDFAKQASQKRKSDESSAEEAVSVSPPTKKRSTTKQRAAADPHNPVNNLVDSLRPDLMLVFIGLNPGLMTAATGHAYSHPSNLFWKLLNWSEVTPVRHNPSETHDLMDLYSIGNTNICLRPTRSGDGLSKEELLAGAGVLEEKIARYKPEAVCIVGKSIWETIYRHKTGKHLKAPGFWYGWQDEEMWLGRTVKEDGTLEWQGARTFVATTTSGLAASMKPQEKLEIWKPLGRWLQDKRGVNVEEEDEPRVKQESDVNVKQEV